MPFGYSGKILHVNLTTRAIEAESPPEAFYRMYLGGSALGLYYVLKNVVRGADPLSPQNVHGAFDKCADRRARPWTLALCRQRTLPADGADRRRAGGRLLAGRAEVFGIRRRRDRGAQAPGPVYLWLHNGVAELREAGHLWGLENLETMRQICAELGDNSIEVTGIGPAGENLVALRQHYQQGQPRPWPYRHGGRHGQQTAQGDCGARRRPSHCC